MDNSKKYDSKYYEILKSALLNMIYQVRKNVESPWLYKAVNPLVNTDYDTYKGLNVFLLHYYCKVFKNRHHIFHSYKAGEVFRGQKGVPIMTDSDEIKVVFPRTRLSIPQEHLQRIHEEQMIFHSRCIENMQKKHVVPAGTKSIGKFLYDNALHAICSKSNVDFSNHHSRLNLIAELVSVSLAYDMREYKFVDENNTNLLDEWEKSIINNELNLHEFIDVFDETLEQLRADINKTALIKKDIMDRTNKYIESKMVDMEKEKRVEMNIKPNSIGWKLK